MWDFRWTKKRPQSQTPSLFSLRTCTLVVHISSSMQSIRNAHKQCLSVWFVEADDKASDVCSNSTFINPCAFTRNYLQLLIQYGAFWYTLFYILLPIYTYSPAHSLSHKFENCEPLHTIEHCCDTTPSELLYNTVQWAKENVYVPTDRITVVRSRLFSNL